MRRRSRAAAPAHSSTAFLPFARRVAAIGVHNSLIQTVVKLTAPGVPDLYNGAELWDLSMVDPDNRRPVDYALRAQQLAGNRRRTGSRSRRLPACSGCGEWQDGRIKLGVIMTLLHHRADQPELYAERRLSTAAGRRSARR